MRILTVGMLIVLSACAYDHGLTEDMITQRQAESAQRVKEFDQREADAKKEHEKFQADIKTLSKKHAEQWEQNKVEARADSESRRACMREAMRVAGGDDLYADVLIDYYCMGYFYR